MASTLAAARLTEAHRLAQAREGATAAIDLAQAWDVLDLEAIDATAGVWLDAARGIVTSHAAESARLAQDYLQAFRALEVGAPGNPATWIPNLAQVDTSLLVTGPIRAKKLAGTGRTLDDISDLARSASSAAGQRLTLVGGRDVITTTIQHDRQARGYQRVASGNTCNFCSMLTGRGGVYSEESASFQAHDGCGCTAEPIYGA